MSDIREPEVWGAAEDALLLLHRSDHSGFSARKVLYKEHYEAHRARGDCTCCNHYLWLVEHGRYAEKGDEPSKGT